MRYDAVMSETKLVTAEELLAMGERRCELVRGRVVDVTPAGAGHGRIGSWLNARIRQFVEERDLGVVYGADTGFRLERDPDTVRAPDVAFVAADRLPEIDERKYVPFAPDLAVEVVSPSDTFREVEEKARMWLSSGTQLVWVAEPETERMFVYRPDAPRQELSADDELTGGEVLPGLAIPLARCF
jgi:Uma2 family endonuclease